MPSPAGFARRLDDLAKICPVEGPTKQQDALVEHLGLQYADRIGRIARNAKVDNAEELASGGRLALVVVAARAYKQAIRH